MKIFQHFSAVIVTRGNVDLAPVIAPLKMFDDVVIWDNSKKRTDMGVYGRYAGIRDAKHPFIYVQDDDCVVSPDGIITMMEKLLHTLSDPAAALCANMPEKFRPHYPDSCLVGFGAVFHRSVPDKAFEPFLKHTSIEDDLWRKECDTVLTTLTPRLLVDIGYEDMPYASDDDRMWKQPGHHHRRKQVLEMARKVRDR